MRTVSYYEIADNDLQFLLNDLDAGRFSNIICSSAQNCCEKFLKHVINEYYEPEDENQNSSKIAVLRTHNLRRLLQFIQRDMNIDVSRNEMNQILLSNGYYFTARYPGDEYFIVDEEDAENCRIALLACKEFVYKVMKEKNG